MIAKTQLRSRPLTRWAHALTGS